jgi:antirestriction protein ArdC
MNVYEIITEQIIEKLNKGEIPWHQPWVGSAPKNLVSKKEYRGINPFLLGCQRFSSPYWLSFKQCSDLGGRVRKGEKSTLVVFWKQIKVTEKDSDDEQKTIPMLRYYRVFNTDQCDLPAGKVPVSEVNSDFQPIETCDQVVTDMQNKPTIEHRESRAYYRPSTDSVNMPQKETFVKEEFYYSVLFHELGHSTGHKSRLDRKDFAEGCFGSETYSKEELVAEMTAAFLCGVCQIENKTIENSAAYIKSWLGKLKDDAKLVVLAAAAAQKAADYILNKTYNN